MSSENDNIRFKEIWAMLNFLKAKRAQGITIGDLNARGRVDFAEKVKEELDYFISEVIARQKHADEEAMQNIKFNQESLGERYANAEPNYYHGMDFGSQEPK